MHTAEVLFKFLKFLPLWLFTANKACEISEKPALKKPDGQPNLRYCAFVRHKDLMKLLKRWHSPVLGLGLVLVDITVAARDNPSCSNSDINKHQP